MTIVKTIEEFRATRVLTDSKEFCKYCGMPDDCVNTPTVMVYLEHYYIEILPEGKYLVLFLNQDYLCDTLEKAEEIFWEKFIKPEVLNID